MFQTRSVQVTVVQVHERTCKWRVSYWTAGEELLLGEFVAPWDRLPERVAENVDLLLDAALNRVVTDLKLDGGFSPF